MIDAGRPFPPPSQYSGADTDRGLSSFDAERITGLRRGLDVSQQAFAEILNVSLAPVHAWEQGERFPDGAATRLLTIAERHSKIVREAAARPSLIRVSVA